MNTNRLVQAAQQPISMRSAQAAQAIVPAQQTKSSWSPPPAVLILGAISLAGVAWFLLGRKKR